jgi:XTP/dITP diphosphohydrolase
VIDARPRLLLATANPGKVREFRRLLEGSGYDVVVPADLGLALDVFETGSSYAENACFKARAFARAGQCLALADDSGIEVDALGGGPGMFSARYGGPGLDDDARTALLISELGGIAPAGRTARYRAVVAVADPAGHCEVFEGIQEGTIACAPRGANGFGYDPIFLVDGARTQAEISEAEKDELSHRGKAVRAACSYLAGLLPR